MDRHALERLAHYIVSRRVALGYLNRTDLANSLQLTVRTLADIEHGVRKASPGTYAMLENKLAWAPGSIDTILAGGEPKELVVKLRRATPIAYPTPPPTRSPVPPPKSCSWSCDGASSHPARHVKCGKTGAAFTLAAATGPRRASSTLDAGIALLLNAEPAARRDPQRWRTYEPEFERLACGLATQADRPLGARFPELTVYRKFVSELLPVSGSVTGRVPASWIPCFKFGQR